MRRFILLAILAVPAGALPAQTPARDSIYQKYLDFASYVSSSPVVELNSAHPLPIEPYMGLPQENGEAYEYASNLRLAGNLQGKLLLIIGTSDVNTPFAHTMRMVAALAKAGKNFDMLVLPELNHARVGVATDHSAYWNRRIARYFQEHLKPDAK